MTPRRKKPSTIDEVFLSQKFNKNSIYDNIYRTGFVCAAQREGKKYKSNILALIGVYVRVKPEKYSK